MADWIAFCLSPSVSRLIMYSYITFFMTPKGPVLHTQLSYKHEYKLTNYTDNIKARFIRVTYSDFDHAFSMHALILLR